MRFVLDSSVTMAWIFVDELTEYTEAIRNSLIGNDAITSFIWPVEVTNVLLMAERRKRITRTQAEDFLQILSSMPIFPEPPVTLQGIHKILSIASDSRLTAYDASYLEIAIREKIPIATLDNDLRRVAVQIGMPLFLES